MRLEGLPVAEFGASILKGDHVRSMDIEKGYRCLRLHPAMRNWFIFHCGGCFYQSIALPMGCGRSALLFCSQMAHFYRELRVWGYRVLCYIDDVLVAPVPHGVVAASDDFQRASRIEALMRKLGIKRHPSKGVWGRGVRRLEHLGVVIEPDAMKFEVALSKVEKIKSLRSSLMRTAAMGRRYVLDAAIRSFCGVCVSLYLVMPWARFYTQ